MVFGGGGGGGGGAVVKDRLTVIPGYFSLRL